MSVEQSIELVKWIESLSEGECRLLLGYLCGWKPEIMATLKSERDDES